MAARKYRMKSMMTFIMLKKSVEIKLCGQKKNSKKKNERQSRC